MFSARLLMGATLQIDDNPEELIAALVKTIDEAPAPIPWKKRLVVACWNVSVPLMPFFSPLAMSPLPPD